MASKNNVRPFRHPRQSLRREAPYKPPFSSPAAPARVAGNPSPNNVLTISFTFNNRIEKRRINKAFLVQLIAQRFKQRLLIYFPSTMRKCEASKYLSSIHGRVLLSPAFWLTDLLQLIVGGRKGRDHDDRLIFFADPRCGNHKILHNTVPRLIVA